MARLGIRTHEEWEQIDKATREDWVAFAIHQGWAHAPEQTDDHHAGFRQWLTR